MAAKKKKSGQSSKLREPTRDKPSAARVGKTDQPTKKQAKKARSASEVEEGESGDPGRKSKPPGSRLSSPRRGARVFTAVGVLSAALIAVSLNLLVSRFYKRWDWTSAGLYTLSQPTLDTLHDLDQPIDVIVFLSRSDNMRVSVEHMLTAYSAETRQLRVRYVDPDQNPAEFLALQKQYDINEMTTDEGRLVSETALVVARGKKHWYITADDIIAYDESGAVKPKLEQALTVALRNVIGTQTTRVCFTSGHNEPSIDSGAGDGMAELKFRIQHDNYETETLDLTHADWSKQLVDCQVVVAAPQVPVEADEVSALERWFVAGGNVLLLLNPVLSDDEPRILPSGLQSLTERAGITLGNDLVIEDSPKLKLTATGEVFLAEASRHDITRGLFSTKDDTTTPLIFKIAQSLGKTPSSTADVLARSSVSAFTIKDVKSFLQARQPPSKSDASKSGPFPVALASELPKPKGDDAGHGPRMVVVGTTSIALNDNWRTPALAPNAAFVTSALSWLAARPPIVDVPEKQSHDVGLNLTEESQSDVAQYVLLYMPLASLLLGGFVMYRRRSTERKSRRREEDDA
ncbi:MAG: GldG family protein [Myxococcales bacterium]|nr:GldG family protein [Myxococcales bacterium]